MKAEDRWEKAGGFCEEQAAKLLGGMAPISACNIPV